MVDTEYGRNGGRRPASETVKTPFYLFLFSTLSPSGFLWRNVENSTYRWKNEYIYICIYIVPYWYAIDVSRVDTEYRFKLVLAGRACESIIHYDLFVFSTRMQRFS